MNIFQSLQRQVGITDEVTNCFCCGKANLKKTVVFETTDEWQANGGDQFVFLGSTCASSKTKTKGHPSKVNAHGRTQVEEQEHQEKLTNIQAYKNMLIKDGANEAQAEQATNAILNQNNGYYVLIKRLAMMAT